VRGSLSSATSSGGGFLLCVQTERHLCPQKKKKMECTCTWSELKRRCSGMEVDDEVVG
jgi:hypothetical protein